MFRIGIITDLQYADAPSTATRNYRRSIPKFLEAVGELEAAGVDMIFHLGDAADHDEANLSAVVDLFQKIRVPFYNLLGNHDYLIEDEKKRRIFELTHIPAPGYYSFLQTDPDSGDVWKFIFLNGNEISSYAALTEEERQNAEAVRERYRLPNGELPHSWNGAMSETQLAWLETELAAAKDAGQRVIVCNHFPLYAQGDGVGNMPSIPILKRIPIYFNRLGVTQWNGEELLALIDRYAGTVRAYFAGHLHDGAFGIRDDVYHVTFKGMVETEPNAWAIVTINGDEIDFNDFPKESAQ